MRLFVVFIASLLLAGCLAGSLRPSSDWTKMSAPPQEAAEIIAAINGPTKGFFSSAKNAVWYSKPDEYLIYVPPYDEDGCGEGAVKIKRTQTGWVQEPWGKGFPNICID